MTELALPDGQQPLSFVTCVSSDEVYRANLLSSPCLGAGTAHEVIAFPGCKSAADGLNAGFGRARYDWLVCVHQDVYLPAGWDRCLVQQLGEAERRFGPVGVAGVFGVGDINLSPDLSQPLSLTASGWVVDRGRLVREGDDLPARVATLDELLLVVRRDSDLRFEPALGFHLYGADICLQAHELRLAVVAVEALCHHNSQRVGLPDEFYESASIFARKWHHRLPVATSCAVIEHNWVVEG
jgi:hypothetical protein